MISLRCLLLSRARLEHLSRRRDKTHLSLFTHHSIGSACVVQSFYQGSFLRVISERGAVKGLLNIERSNSFAHTYLNKVLEVACMVTNAITSGFSERHHRAVHSMRVLGKGECHYISCCQLYMLANDSMTCGII